MDRGDAWIVAAVIGVLLSLDLYVTWYGMVTRGDVLYEANPFIHYTMPYSLILLPLLCAVVLPDIVEFIVECRRVSSAAVLVAVMTKTYTLTHNTLLLLLP